jgi:branched-chain amino acid aminotransferase
MLQHKVTACETTQTDQSVQRFAKGAAYVDGAIVPIEDAKISMLDWGFLHSDATYDVVHVWEGSFFRLNDHLDRFARSIDKLHMKLQYDREELREILFKCVRKTGFKNAYVEMICTRGLPAPGSRDPRQCTNRFYAFVVPFIWIKDPKQQIESGLRVHVSSVHRIAPESVDPTVKNYHWLDLVNGLFEAYENGQETVVLTDRAGNIAEGPGFNVFVIREGAICTPDRGVLHGVTRKTAIELATSLGLKVSEEDISIADFLAANEIFITSTAGGVMPVTAVNGKSVGDGSAGPITNTLRRNYWDAHADPKYSEPVF